MLARSKEINSSNNSLQNFFEKIGIVYKPNECLLIANIQDNLITDIIEFIGLECKKIHRINKRHY